MARILVACAAADGHVNPFLPVVQHLIKHGHEIVWLCGRAYRNKIESTGARFVPMPKDFDPNGIEIYDFKPELKKLKGIAQIKFYIKTWCYDMTKPTLKIIDELREDFEPDIYISDPMVYGPYLQAEQTGKPSINLHVLPLPLSSKDHGPFGTGIGPSNSFFGRLRIRVLNFLVDNIIFRDLRKYCNHLRSEVGLEPFDHIFNDFLKSATKVMTVTIPGFDYPRSDMPNNVEYIGPIMPRNSTDFVEPEWWPELRDKRPVILVNQGTIANDITELILPTMKALRNEDVLLIAVPVKEQIKDLPSNVKVAKFIPFAHLLPHVDVMVTNGGYGATHMALAHGIPLVTSGGSEDKMEVSARVEYSGCGINLKKLKPRPEQIRRAVDLILAKPEYKRRAAQLQQEIAFYGPLELIERAVADLT